MPVSLFGRSRLEVETALPERESVDCPLCRRAPRPFGVDFQGLRLARCPTCGLEFQHPRPRFEQLTAAVYNEAYHPDAHRALDGERAATCARQLAGLTRYRGGRPATVLDVGCGAGAFLRFARDRGWEAAGTDIVVTPPARATGAALWEGELPRIDFGRARFDVVRFNHVLEHTREPLRELQRARDVLAEDGLLLVGVPNIGGASMRLKNWQSRLRLKARPWKHYGALHHLWFFTGATLGALVRAAGFEVIAWETPVPSRPGRFPVVRDALRQRLARARLGGVIDLYAQRAAQQGGGAGRRPA